LSATKGFGGRGLVWGLITGGGEAPEGVQPDARTFIMLAISLAFAIGCYLVFVSARRREPLLAKLRSLSLGSVGPLSRKFYFDDVYAYVVVMPLKGAAYLARLVLENIFTGILTLAGWLGQGLSLGLRRFQTGKVHQYAVGMLLIIFLLAFWLGAR